MYSLLPDIIENEGRGKIASGEAKVNTQDNATQEKINTNNIEAGCSEHEFCEPDDIYDGEISLGTKPGVPAAYLCKHQTKLQAKEAALQRALKKVANLETRNKELEEAMVKTRKNAYEAEEKMLKKRRDLTLAKQALIAYNADFDVLERRVEDLERRNGDLERDNEDLQRGNEDLSKVLSDTLEESDKTHRDLTLWKNKYTHDYNDAVRLAEIHLDLGANLFYQMTRLEVVLANQCGMFFFEAQDRELKLRACMHLPLDPAYTRKQSELCKLLDSIANDSLPGDEWTAADGHRLAIEAPPMVAATVGCSRITASEIEKLQHLLDQETRVGDVAEEVSGSEVEASPVDDAEKLRSLLGYNTDPEEAFYPQYEIASDLPMSNESVEETFELQELQDSNAAIDLPIYTSYESNEGPKVQSLLGYNAEPEEVFYPQYSPRNENEDGSAYTDATRQDEEQTTTNVSLNEPIFDTEPGDRAITTITPESATLTVDASFADTPIDLEGELNVRKQRADTSSTATTEIDTQSNTAGHTPILSSQETSPTTTAPTSRNSSMELNSTDTSQSTTTPPTSRDSSLSIDIQFSNTSQPFVAGAKPRMSRAQRREAALMKKQIEDMVAKQKAEDKAAEKEGEKKSRQERRAAERKAWKEGLKKPRRNVVRF